MDDIQTPPTERRSHAPIIILSIIIIILIGVLVWCLWWHKNSEPADSEKTVTATGPCTNGAENPTPDGFTVYENASLGYKFAYPSAWGDVSVTTTPMASESGNYVMGRFSANDNVWFGGNATDYTVSGREGIPTDLPGYLKAADKFYTVEIWRFSDGATTEDRNDLQPIEMPYEEKAACNTKALMTHWEASELSSVGPADIARFTLQPTNHYYGVNVVMNQPTDASKEEMNKLIKSFQLLP